MSAKEKLDFIEKAYKEGNMPIWDYEKFKEQFKEELKSAREMFEELGYEYDFIQNKNSEDTITYHKDNLHIQFNLISKIVVCQNDTSYMYYNSALFFINKDTLKAINKQVEELGWNK